RAACRRSSRSTISPTATTRAARVTACRRSASARSPARSRAGCPDCSSLASLGNSPDAGFRHPPAIRNRRRLRWLDGNRGPPVEQEIEQYLHRHIPLSAAMGVRVRAASPERVELAAPLAPNINHHETLFGGSGAAIATLSAWTLVNIRLR